MVFSEENSPQSLQQSAACRHANVMPPAGSPEIGVRIREISDLGIARFREEAVNAPPVTDLVAQSMMNREGVIDLLEASRIILEASIVDATDAPATVRRVLTTVYEIDEPDEPARDLYRYAAQVALGVDANTLSASTWRTAFDNELIDTSQMLRAMVVIAAGCLSLSPEPFF